MSKHQLRAVLFDLWGTLIYNIPLQTNYGEVAGAAGVKPEVLWKTWQKFADQALTGKIKTGEERAHLVLQSLGRSPEAIEIAAPMLAEFERKNRTCEIHFYPGVENMLATLRQKGYKTGLISNCNYLTPPLVEQLQLRDKMDAIILSCEVGTAKPQPEIYLMATNQLQVSPGECLYIGDGGDKELVGAKQVGLNTALVEQEFGHAYRFPHKEFIADHRLPVITAVLDYLP